MKKVLSISLNLNFTPNTLGCYGLREIGWIFSNKIRNFELLETPEFLNLRFPEGL